MAPGPNLCRLERTSAARQTWRVGVRDPGVNLRGFRAFPDISDVGRAAVRPGRAMAAAALQPAEEDRIVQVHVAERRTEQLEGVAGQGVGVLGGDAELVGHPCGTLAQT